MNLSKACSAVERNRWLHCSMVRASKAVRPQRSAVERNRWLHCSPAAADETSILPSDCTKQMALAPAFRRGRIRRSGRCQAETVSTQHTKTAQANRNYSFHAAANFLRIEQQFLWMVLKKTTKADWLQRSLQQLHSLCIRFIYGPPAQRTASGQNNTIQHVCSATLATNTSSCGF